MTIIPDRLALLDSLVLGSGGHSAADLFEQLENAACVMEATAFIAGEPWSADPKCVSPVLTDFGISLNDSLPAAGLRDGSSSAALLMLLVYRVYGLTITRFNDNTPTADVLAALDRIAEGLVER